MAVIVRLSNVKLDPIVGANGEVVKQELLMADWEIADREIFNESSIVLSSYNDKVNLTSIRFPQNLDPNKKYWARVRVKTTTSGWSVWTNRDVVPVQSLDNLNIDIELPSKVSTPIITTDSNSAVHVPTYFRIIATGFYCIGSATLAAVSYFIEDLDGNVVWARDRDEINKESILVNDVTLKLNSVYRIKVRFHSTTKDTSQLGTYDILVKATDKIVVNENLLGINKEAETVLSIQKDTGLTEVVWRIIYKDNQLNTLIWEEKVEGGSNTVTIPKGTMKTGENYILMIKTNLSEDQWYVANL
ncbi:MAG: hypothetical protein K2M73_08035 [Lachnospiraceae bacterium]|nr:hypothetical protein [Lachnospiraceae bacterium]